MGLVGGEIPGMLGGVSQQSDLLRFPNQGRKQLNGLTDPRRGLGKRTPIEFLRALSVDDSALHTFVHFIDRDENEKYVVLIANGHVKVYDLDGDVYAVEETADSIRYLRAQQSNQDLRALTVADTTFVLNRQVTVAEGVERSSAPNFWGLVWIRQGDYDTDYSVTVAGRRFRIRTASSTYSETEANWIAAQLVTLMTTGSCSAGTYDITDTGAGTTDPLDTSIFTVLHNSNDSVFAIQHRAKQQFKIEGTSSRGSTFLSVIGGSVQSFDLLPDRAIHGQRVKVVGDPTDAADDYWVVFTSTRQIDDAVSAGTWSESVAPNIPVGFDATTMPYVVERFQRDSGDIYFKVQPFEWSHRLVGDEETNPSPGFIGKKLTDITVFYNKLFPIGGARVAGSRTGDFSDFWRFSVLTVRDDDPIDGEATTSQVLRIDHAVPFNEELLLVSEKAQQVFQPGDTLTPKSFAIKATSAFQADPYCRPVTADSMAFLPYYDSRYTQIREFYVADKSGRKAAVLNTSHIPEYISGRPILQAASTTENLLAVLSDGERDVLNVYKWVNENDNRVTAAWSKWDVGATILGMQWVGSTLYMIVVRDGLIARRTTDEVSEYTGTLVDNPSSAVTGIPEGDDNGDGTPDDQFGNTAVPYSGDGWAYGWSGASEDLVQGTVCLVKIDIGIGISDPGEEFRTLLDYRVTNRACTVSYDPVTDLTSFTLPYPTGPDMRVVTRHDSDDETWVVGQILDATLGPDNTIFVPGDVSDKALWFGEPYHFVFEFTPPIYQKAGVRGGLVPVPRAKIQLLTWKVHFVDTGAFSLDVTPLYRDTAENVYDGRVLGSADPLIGSPSILEGSLKVDVGADSREVEIVLRNSTHLPSWFTIAEWEGSIRLHSPSIG